MTYNSCHNGCRAECGIVIGPQGPRGNYGKTGHRGHTGDDGNIGNIGNIGFRGYQGTQGATGLVNSWYVGSSNGGTEIVNYSSGTPIKNDLLLDLDTCEIYINNGTKFIGTDNILSPCLSCNDVSECIKTISLPEPDICNVSFTLINIPPLFTVGTANYITTLVVLGVYVDNPQSLGTFSTPAELESILSPLGWQSVNSFNTWIYIIQADKLLIPPQTLNQNLNTIVFNTGQSFNMTVECLNETAFSCSALNTYNTYILANYSPSSCSTVTGITGFAWVDPKCLSLTGPTGITGIQGTSGYTGAQGPVGHIGATGPTGPEASEVIELLENLDPNVLLNCQYNGILGQDVTVFLNSFNNNSTITYTVELSNVTKSSTTIPTNLAIIDVVEGPISFATNVELNIALTALNIVINGNYVYILSSTNFINQIIFRLNGYAYKNVIVTPVNCCPSTVQTNNSILTINKTTNQMSWVPGDCVLIPDFDLAFAVSSLPTSSKFKCTITFDASQPFLQNINFPWTITNMTLFNSNLTSLYKSNIYNYNDLSIILANNNWFNPSSSLWSYNFYSNVSQINSQNIINITDTNGQLFYFNNPLPVCIENNNNDIQVVLNTINYVGITGATGATGDSNDACCRTGATGTCSKSYLGTIGRLLDSLCSCCDTTYLCDTTINPTELILNLQIPSPWKIQTIVLSGINQTILNTNQFTSALQLSYLLSNMGWTTNDNILSYIVNNLPKPNNDSYITLMSTSGPIEKIILPVLSTANCTTTNKQRLIFSRTENQGTGMTGGFDFCGGEKDDKYCFINSNCFQQQVINVDVCKGPTGIKLENIPDCSYVPTYDLVLDIRQALILNISQHFNTNVGPYIIKGYRTNQGFVELSQNIDAPFNILTLCDALIKLSWVLIQPDVILLNTAVVELLLNASNVVITGIDLNLYGSTNPNYVIPVYSILRIECSNTPLNGQLLLKYPKPSPTGTTGPTGTIGSTGINSNAGETGLYCYVDVNCIVPQAPVPINLEYELSTIIDCSVLCGSTGENLQCDDIPHYVNCTIVTQTDLDLLHTIFGTTDVLEIVQYELINGITINLSQIIGANPTITDIANALSILGWTNNSLILPVQFKYASTNNIQYIFINSTTSLQYVPPFPYAFNCNCITSSYCPSTNNDNDILIINPNEDVCWTRICSMTGAMGVQGPIGTQGISPTGPQGPRGKQGATSLVKGVTGPQGFQGVQGAEGTDGSQGVEAPTGQYLTAFNLGTGAFLFATRTGATGSPILEFKSLIGQSNININDTIDTLEINVDKLFNWSNTTFSGTATAESSLTFDNGSILNTNTIQETIANDGVIINDIIFNNGGIGGLNNSIISDTLFLQTYENNIHVTNLQFASPFSKIVQANYEIPYERIGNTVSLYFPTITTGVTGPAPVDNPTITNNIQLPLQLRNNVQQDYLIQYIDPNKTALPSYPPNGKTGSLNRLGLLSIKNGYIQIYQSLENIGFSNKDTFSYNQPLTIIYTLT